MGLRIQSRTNKKKRVPDRTETSLELSNTLDLFLIELQALDAKERHFILAELSHQIGELFFGARAKAASCICSRRVQQAKSEKARLQAMKEFFQTYQLSWAVAWDIPVEKALTWLNARKK